MVSSGLFSSTDIRKYPSSRGGIPPTYTPYTTCRRPTYTNQDLRGGMMSDRDGSEEPSSQRKRIAVACMRCRKRKIKCTGDSGNGQPCHNCKNAGYEPCQFLRVSSHETALKTESFSYNLDVARNFQARGSSIVTSVPASSMTAYPEAIHISASETLPYRNSSAYAYNSKQCYPVSGWSNAYSEDGGIDYSMYPQPYQPVQDNSYMMGYRMNTNGANTARASGSNLMYVESDPSFGYGNNNSNNNSTSSANLIHRSTSNADTNSFSFSNVSSGLSNTLNTGDRLLPTPSSRPLARAGQHPSRAESISSAYSKTSQSSNGGSSPGPLSEAPTSYSGFDSSPMTSYPATLASQVSRTNDAGSTNAALSSDTSISAVDEPLRLGPELTYKYTDTTRRYTSSYTSDMASYLSGNHSRSPYMMSGSSDDRKSVSSMLV